jgi:eukaryotic-like serine/threonine-protein kinase
VLNQEVSRSPLEVARFRREADIAVRLSSPHVVDVLDFGEAPGGALYLVMELLQGESVRDRLKRTGRLPPEEVAELLRQLMRGLDAAHRAGIVHRDLKPENLWLVPEDGRDRLKILDFGIAKLVDLPGGAERTQAGLVMGTPQFLSPEQAVGAEVDHRADLYSAGIVAYLLLTGQHPFSTFDPRSLLRAHAYDPVPSPARDAPELLGQARRSCSTSSRVRPR